MKLKQFSLNRPACTLSPRFAGLPAPPLVFSAGGEEDRAVGFSFLSLCLARSPLLDNDATETTRQQSLLAGFLLVGQETGRSSGEYLFRGLSFAVGTRRLPSGLARVSYLSTMMRRKTRASDAASMPMSCGSDQRPVGVNSYFLFSPGV